MNCQQFVDRICDYLEDRMSAEERAEFEQCRDSDACCKKYFDAYVTAIALGKSVCECPKTNPPGEVTEEFIETIILKVKSTHRSE